MVACFRKKDVFASCLAFRLSVPCVIIGLAAGLSSLPAQADDWGLSLALSSDYVVRGITRSMGQGSQSLDFGWRHPNGWAVDLGVVALHQDAEGRLLQASARVAQGWQWDQDWSGDLSYTHAAYPGSAQRRNFNYDELSGRLVWQGRWFISGSWFPKMSRRSAQNSLLSAQAFSASLGLHQNLPLSLALDAGLGVYTHRSDPARSYAFGSVDLSWSRGPWQCHLSHIASNAESEGFAQAGRAGQRWLATLQLSF